MRKYGILGSVAGAALAVALLTPSSSASSASGGFEQVNLISDVPGLAQITDFRVSNPWGLALGPETPVWINNNGSATSEVYSGANGRGPLKQELVVHTTAGLTGIAFNPTDAFVAHQGDTPVPTKFLFAAIDGYLSGWGPTAQPFDEAIPTRFTREAQYFGMAVAKTSAGRPRMYAAALTLTPTGEPKGKIVVFDGRFRPQLARHRFVDPKASKLQPYNVAVFHQLVYVTYTDLLGESDDDAIGVFRLNGDFVRHLTSNRHLDAPWGMAMAPAGWGRFGKMLLVGNVDDGHISAFDPATGAFKGQLKDADGRKIENSGLWGLVFGNGHTGTPRDLLFAAGIDGYSHGLFGLIHPN